jgi:hypothetical protein
MLKRRQEGRTSLKVCRERRAHNNGSQLSSVREQSVAEQGSFVDVKKEIEKLRNKILDTFPFSNSI